MCFRKTEKKLKKAVLLILSASILLGMSGCSGNISETVEELRESGYVTEEVDDGFYISENGTDYYFENGLTGPNFKKAVLKAPAKKDDRKATVTITKQGFSTIAVQFESPYLNKSSKSKSSRDSAYYYFEFKNDFKVENITNDRGFHDVTGDYQSMINTYLSPEELQSIYDRGLKLEEEIRSVSSRES